VARKKREVDIDIATPLGLRSGERSTFIRRARGGHPAAIGEALANFVRGLREK
jgi:hypothetical protein